MKWCQNCKRSYADETLVFCLEDGTRLMGARPKIESPTIRYSQASQGRQGATTNPMKRILPFLIITVVLIAALAVM